MDTKTSMVELTKAVAWPLTLAVILVSFRKQLLRLSQQLTNFKYDKFEFQFGKEVADVAKQAQTSLPPVPEKAGVERVRERLTKLAMTSPAVAIIEAWRYLEGELLEVAEHRKIELAPSVRDMPRVLSAVLYKDGLLSEPQHELVVRLRDLRNEVTHSRGEIVDIDRAMSYIESVLRLSASIHDAEQ